MTSALVVAESHLVPEERAIAMIESCSAQLELAVTIPHVKRMISHAEAINLIMKKINASKRAKEAALVLVVEAEQQLGRVTKQIPQAKRGGYARLNPGQKTKRSVLIANGIHPSRCAMAEKLADVPRDLIRNAADQAKSKTLSGVSSALGLRTSRDDYRMPEASMRDLGYLAGEAISLLERCIQSKQPPHAGTVAEMRDRLTRLVAR